MFVVNNIVNNMALGSLVMAWGWVGKTGAGEQKSCTNFIHYGVFLPTSHQDRRAAQTAQPSSSILQACCLQRLP